MGFFQSKLLWFVLCYGFHVAKIETHTIQSDSMKTETHTIQSDGTKIATHNFQSEKMKTETRTIHEY